MTTHNPKTHVLLEENPEYLADLVFDALLSRLQYDTGNRVITLKSRLTHDQRKLVVNADGLTIDVEDMAAHWIGRQGLIWVERVFKGNLPGRFWFFTENCPTMLTDIKELLKTFKEITLDDLRLAIPKEHLL